MPKINRSYVSLAAACLLAVTLSACGGGGGSAAPAVPVSSVTVEGIAATGAPLSGTVELSDSSYPTKTATAPINADGTFSLDVAGLKAPFILKAADSSGNAHYSFAKAAGMANINPLSTLTVAVASGAWSMADLADLHANHNLATLQVIASSTDRAAAEIRSALQPLLAEYGAETADPVAGPYSVNGQGLDGLFDQVEIGISGGMVSLKRKDTKAEVYSAPVGGVSTGSVDTGAMPTPKPYYMPGNAELTLKIEGDLPQGKTIRNASLSIKLPLGISIDQGESRINTAIPVGAAAGANVYPAPTLTATNNTLGITMSALAGFGTGELLTVRLIVPSATLMATTTAESFAVTSSVMYADIYKNERLKGLTVVPVSLAYPTREGKAVYDTLCAGCHTMDPSDSVITPSLYGKSSLVTERFRSAHHGKSLASTQIDDLKAYMDAYYRGEKILW